MEAYQTIFEILLYLSEGLIILYYARSMFEQKYNNFISILGIFAGYIILFFVYQLDKAILNTLFITFINIIVFTLLYKCNLKSSFFHSILLSCIMVACEWILIFTISTIFNEDFNAYQNNFNIHVINVVSSKLLYYIIVLVFVKLFSKQAKYNKNNSVYWSLLIMPLTSLIVLLTLRYITFEIVFSNKVQILCSVASALLLISNLIVFFLYEYAIKNWEELYELQSVKQKQEADKTYLTVLEQNNINLKVFTHDIKNHLEQISNFTDNNDVRSYVQKLYNTVNKYEVVGMSKNKTLDIIISKYIALCENKNVEISFNVKTANLSGIDNVDLSTILNNVLDNALESAVQSERRKITVDIYSKQSFEVIKIKNSCDIPPKTEDHKLLTIKKDSEFHGYGTKSINKTLKKYNGEMQWDYDEANKTFKTTVIIPMN